MEIRRSFFVDLTLADRPQVNLAAFLEGRVEVGTETRVIARSPLGPSRLEIGREELVTLLQLPTSRWLPWKEAIGPVGEEGLLRLAQGGLVVCRGEGISEALEGLRIREELLLEGQWGPAAAQYHFGTSLDQERAAESTESFDFEALRESSAERAAEFVERHGPPPPAFHHLEGQGGIDLPLADGEGELFELLRRRRTHREFDRGSSLRLDHLATLLRWVFAPVAYHSLGPGVELLRKSSPSGGSLHPIEAYPLVLDVEGLDCGLYHYAADSHRLEPLRELSNDTARRLAIEMGKKQLYVGEAHVLVILTARWLRNFWKYRRNNHTYGVVLMDAGHLSQTFYLVATRLGLGAFYTGAVHRAEIARSLGLEQVVEGPLGLCGCGPVHHSEGGLPDGGLPLAPFEPGQTKP